MGPGHIATTPLLAPPLLYGTHGGTLNRTVPRVVGHEGFRTTDPRLKARGGTVVSPGPTRDGSCVGFQSFPSHQGACRTPEEREGVNSDALTLHC